MSNKNNVILQTRDKVITHHVSCGYRTEQEIQDIMDAIHQSTLKNTCLAELSYGLHETVFTWFNGNKSHPGPKLVIGISTYHVNAPCGVRTNHGCLKCIKNGKCRDKLVIDLLGKKLFAEKYQGK